MKTDDNRWLLLQTALHKKQLEQAFALFRGAGIEPILIKGWAALRFYPDNDKRYPGDIDLCIEPEKYPAALELQKEGGGFLPIDLHKGFRRLDTVSYPDVFSHSKLIKLGETDIRVLCDEDNLRILCIHWLNDGGGYREKLKDIHYAVENRREDFDWERCLDVVSARRRRWIICAILLAHKYFATKIDDTPVAGEKELPSWLIKTVEREWRSPLRIKPLETLIKKPKEFWEQLKKRIPPNALQATIEMEGDFDRLPRIYYQLTNTLARILPSLKRIKMVLGAAKTRN